MSTPCERSLTCPVDTSGLHRIGFRRTEVDVCRLCGGVWFDRGELDDVLREALHEPRSVAKLDPLYGNSTDHKPERGLECPVCEDTALIQEIYAAISNVELDRCPTCDGRWADGGELTALVNFICKPGRPDRMRAYGEAIAEAVAEREKLKDLAALGRRLSTPVNPSAVFLPKIILPVGTSVGVQGFPQATVFVAFLSAVVFLLQLVTALDAQNLGLKPVRAVEGEGIHNLVTYMFAHAGVLHLLGNALFLSIFAPPLEATVGRWRFLAQYLLFGVMAGTAFVLANPGEALPVVGASGAISGVMGAFLVLHPSSTVSTFLINRVVDVPSWIYFGAWIGFQLLYLSLDQSGGLSSSVAFSAHVGGFFAGAISGWAYKRGVAAAGY